MNVASLSVAVGALLFSVVSIAMQLVGRDVIKTLHFTQSHEIPDLKRQLARCLFFLVPLGLAFAASCVPAAAWLSSIHGNTLPATIPWWITGWMIVGFLVLWFVGSFFWTCLRFAFLLRDPNTTTFIETWLVVWASIPGKDSVVTYSRRQESID